MNKQLKLTVICFLLVVTTTAQTSVKDISALIAAGKLDGNKYKNDYLGLEFTAEDGHAKPGRVVNTEGKRARLVEAVSDSGEPDKSYSFAIMVDSLENYPQLRSSEQYVRSVRHSLERERLRTVREEYPVEIAGKPFTGAIMEVPGKEVSYFRAMFSTLIKGYVLSFDLTARKQQVIEREASRLVKFRSEH